MLTTTFVIYVNNYYICICKLSNMGRKGDIVSKVIGVRAPIRVYTKLLNEASDKGISISQYCLSLLSKDNFNQGGQTQIEYKEKMVFRDKIVEVPKIEYRDRIIEKKVEIDNPKISQEMVALKKQIELLKLEIKKLTPIKYTTKSTKNKEECHPNYEWHFVDETGTYINLGSFESKRKKKEDERKYNK